MAQAAFNGLPLQSMLVHGGPEKLVIIATIVFGVQHRNVGVLHKRLGIRPIIWVDADPNA